MANSKPLRKEFLLNFGRVGFPEKAYNEALDRLARSLVRMQAELESSGGPWLLGADLTVADIALMPVIVRLDDLGLGDMWDGKPAIPRWLEVIQAHAAYEPTFYHGSLLTEQYPHLRQ